MNLAAIPPYLRSCANSLRGLTDQQKSALTAAIDRLVAATKKPATEAQMIAMHPVFLDVEGLKGRNWYRNLIVAPGRNLGYGAQVMPGIAEALADEDGERIAFEVKRMVRAIDRASAALN